MAKRPSTTPDQRGEGDELHQGVRRGEPMTTATGTPLGDGQNSLKVGDRGPTLLEDFSFRDADVFVTRCASLGHWEREIRV